KLLGAPVTSIHLYGYNNASNKYEGVWMYTRGTSIMNLSGTSPDEGKTVKFSAAFEGPGGDKQHFKIVLSRVDDVYLGVALIAPSPGGGYGPTLETAYTRKK